MNILHLLPFWTMGGVETFISTLSKFSSHTHYVRADKSYAELPESLRKWQGEHVDVLHYHHATPLNIVPERKDILKAKRIFTVHNYYHEKPFIGTPHKTIAVSLSAAGRMRHHGIDVDLVIPPPVDLSIFHRGFEGVDDWRNILCIGDDETVVMWAGRVCPGKRPELLGDIIRANPQYRYIVVGDDYLAGGMGYVPESVRSAIEHGANVCHLPLVAHEDMASLYRLADVFISTSLAEGFGLTVVEAMACSTPVVVPDVPALNEIVGHGAFGQCVNSLNVERFSEAVENSLANGFIWSQRGVEQVRRLRVDANEVAMRYDVIYVNG